MCVLYSAIMCVLYNVVGVCINESCSNNVSNCSNSIRESSNSRADRQKEQVLN